MQNLHCFSGISRSIETRIRTSLQLTACHHLLCSYLLFQARRFFYIASYFSFHILHQSNVSLLVPFPKQTSFPGKADVTGYTLHAFFIILLCLFFSLSLTSFGIRFFEAALPAVFHRIPTINAPAPRRLLPVSIDSNSSRQPQCFPLNGLILTLRFSTIALTIKSSIFIFPTNHIFAVHSFLLHYRNQLRSHQAVWPVFFNISDFPLSELIFPSL